MLNYKPKLAEVDPDNPNMWFRCDRCGFLSCIKNAVWQFDFRGTPQPINTRVLTCGRPNCLDVPQIQNSPIILSPDPEPVFNARPYPYTVSETNWLVTEDGDIIDTDDGDNLITAIPNPSTNVQPGENPVVVDATVNITTENDEEIVTEADTPLNYDPNPGTSFPP